MYLVGFIYGVQFGAISRYYLRVSSEIVEQHFGLDMYSHIQNFVQDSDYM